MARPKKHRGPCIYWRKGGKQFSEHRPGARAYADLRVYSAVGGGREALAEPGTTWGTTDPKMALELFELRVAELKEKRRGLLGVTQQKQTTLAKLVRHHLIMKAKAGTSANLTESALDRNIELGLLVRDRALGLSVVRHFQALIERGLVRAIPE